MATRSKKRKARREKFSAMHRVEKHKSEHGSSYLDIPDGIGRIKINRAGNFRFDIIPYRTSQEANTHAPENEIHYERTYWRHGQIGSAKGIYICLRKTFGKKCPICEMLDEMSNAGEEQKLINRMVPKERQLFNVIDLADPDAGIQVWEYSYYLFGRVLDSRIENQEEGDDYEFFSDPEFGTTLRIAMEEDRIEKTVFYQATHIDFKKRREQYGDKIIDEAHNLDKMLKVFSYDKLRRIALGLDEDEGETKTSTKGERQRPTTDPAADDYGIDVGMIVELDDVGDCEVVKISGDGTSLTLRDEDDEIHRAISPADVTIIEEKPKKKAKPKRRPKPEDDDVPFDDEEDDPDEEDDEEEEDRPAKRKTTKKAAPKKRTKKKAPPPEEDDEDDDWDEGDEDDWDEDDD